MKNARKRRRSQFWKKSLWAFAFIGIMSVQLIAYNAWHFLTCVRGSDMLHSSSPFYNIVRTSAASILIIAATYITFVLFLRSKRKRKEEKQHNQAFSLQFQAMLEHNSALKAITDAETREILDVNPALLNYFGYTREEMVGHLAQEFILLPDEIAEEKLKGELSDDILFSAAPYRLKNGEIRLMDVHASASIEGGRKLFYILFFDVTDKERYWKELLLEKEMLRTTLQSIGDGVVTIDKQGIVTDINSVAERFMDCKKELAVGRHFTEMFFLQNEHTGKMVENPTQAALETGLSSELASHTELVNRHGERIPIAGSVAPIKTEEGKIFGIVMVLRDVRDERERGKKIEYLSYHDSLTGLYNRRYIEEAMDRLDVEEEYPVSVIMADVNGLKITNDVFGHQIGDVLLNGVTGLLRKCCQEEGIIGRWDGKGYPRGLKGEEIPLACRILSVADAFDAMTSERVYREILPFEEAVAEIERNAGTQFGPQIAKLFAEIIGEKGTAQ